MTQEERDMLLYKPQNAHNALSAAEEAEMNAYCEDYKRFLDASKTERECVFSAIELAEKRGFVEYKRGMALNPGDKVYYNNRGKAIMLAVIGSEFLAKGANIGAAHTDAPRLDIKPRPLFQASHAEMAYLNLKTRRHPQVSVGRHAAGAARQGHAPRRQRGLCQDRRRPQ